MAKKNYNVVKLTVELNVMVSDEMLKRLNNGEATTIVADNCFKNNTRGVKSVDFEVLQSTEVWEEAKNKVYN